MDKVKRLIFVDTDDTRRAPMAEMITRAKRNFSPFPEVLSRGLVVLFPEPLDPKAEAVLTANGHQVENFISSQLKQEDITENTLILTMEDAQKTRIWEQFENAHHVYTLREYAETPGDVPVFYGMTLQDYGSSYDEMEKWILKLVKRLAAENG